MGEVLAGVGTGGGVWVDVVEGDPSFEVRHGGRYLFRWVGTGKGLLYYPEYCLFEQYYVVPPVVVSPVRDFTSMR